MFPRANRVLICGQIGDPEVSPTPGATISLCSDCEAEVYMSLQSQYEQALKGTPVACVQCYHRHAQTNPTILVRQREDD